jgi:hypothetical protein
VTGRQITGTAMRTRRYSRPPGPGTPTRMVPSRVIRSAFRRTKCRRSFCPGGGSGLRLCRRSSPERRSGPVYGGLALSSGLRGSWGSVIGSLSHPPAYLSTRPGTSLHVIRSARGLSVLHPRPGRAWRHTAGLGAAECNTGVHGNAILASVARSFQALTRGRRRRWRRRSVGNGRGRAKDAAAPDGG